jgi:hypothetical protein
VGAIFSRGSRRSGTFTPQTRKLYRLAANRCITGDEARLHQVIVRVVG